MMLRAGAFPEAAAVVQVRNNPNGDATARPLLLNWQTQLVCSFHLTSALVSPAVVAKLGPQDPPGTTEQGHRAENDQI